MPGNYLVEPHAAHYGRPSWEVTTARGSDDVPVYRDRNRDGLYSAAEKARPTTGSGILFHIPNPRAGGRPSSIGCLNLRAEDWDEFVRAVGGPRARFGFTLIGPR
jgi:hypothetical protein